MWVKPAGSAGKVTVGIKNEDIVQTLMSVNTSNNNQTKRNDPSPGIDLLPEEVVIVNGHPSWTLWWELLALALVIFLVGLGAGIDVLPGALLLSLAIVAYVGYSRKKSRYIVTSDRIVARLGFLSKKTHEYRHPDLQSIQTEQGIIDRLVGRGELKFRTADGTEMVWHGVRGHERVADKIRRKQREVEQ